MMSPFAAEIIALSVICAIVVAAGMLAGKK
jgi:hypothetical protein